MKISVQAKLWNYLSDLFDFFFNKRVFHGKDLYERTFLAKSTGV